MLSSQRRDMFTNNRRLAMLTPRRKGFVPVEVAVEPKFLITVRCFAFGYVLACFTRFDTGESGGSGEGRLGTDFEICQGRGADVALHTGGVPAFF